MSLSQGPVGSKTDLNAKLYPNGETVVFKAKGYKPRPLSQERCTRSSDWRISCFRLFVSDPKVWAAAGCPLGLAILSIFDKTSKGAPVGEQGLKIARAAKGRKGITAYGRRMVRNCAYLIENGPGRLRCVFATCTVPECPIETMAEIHQNWGKVMELYRLSMSRLLQKKGLSGESVSVTEIQHKRYERSGIPVLHVHSVFIGKTVSGQWAISIEEHDDAWLRALNAVVSDPFRALPFACNLQWVRKSAEGYLGKYMSKGVSEVSRAKVDGFERWLPKHWWNASRSLSSRVKRETRNIDSHAEFLADAAKAGRTDVWKWHREVTIETASGYEYTVATYGQLTKEFHEFLRTT